MQRPAYQNINIKFIMQGFATVKSVLSGDTVILMGNASKGPAPEIQLTLAFCQAPRVARVADGIEEPFGWESREYLRKLVIGQLVKFRVLYKVEAINRTFGTIEMKDKDVIRDVVSHGMVSVRAERDDHGQSELYDELMQLQVEARESHRGMWGKIPPPRNVTWNIEDPETFYKINKSMPLAGVIEQVRDGSTLKLYLLEGGEFITLHLAGIQCPRITYNTAGEASYELFSQEARAFTEVRLLNRAVVIYIDGMDKFNNFFGRVEHPKGNITLELVKNGLAKIVDWTLNFLPHEDIVNLRSSELTAKTHHQRIWKDWKPSGVSYSSIQGQVLQVLSGDTLIIVLNDKSPSYMGSQRRVNLSSIRAPKLGNAKKGVEDEDWAQEARDALVSLCIGKKVYMHVDYERSVSTGEEETTFCFCTVQLDNKSKTNLGLEMVRRGLVSVVRHRQDDPCAEDYDQLLIAEEEAKGARKGLFSGKKRGSMRRVDFSENPVKAKTSLHFLQEQRRHSCIVEYVFSASHYLLSIPAENCQFMFTLQGVKAPASSAKGKAETFGDESLALARFSFLQRSMEVEIYSCDKLGNYLGNLFQTGSSRPLSIGLLRDGVVFVNENSIDFCKEADEMEKAETEAKAARKGCWANYVQEKPKELAVSGEMEVKIVYVKSGNEFFATARMDEEKLRTVQAVLKGLPATNDVPVVQPRKGSVYACLEMANGSRHWMRVRVADIRAGRASVYALDEGMEFSTSVRNLREIDADVKSIPPLARACVLAAVEAPHKGQWFNGSRECFQDIADCEKYTARVVLRDSSNRLVVFLYRDSDPDVSMNEMMLSEGWGRLEKNAFTRFAAYEDILKSMKQYQDDAIEDRVGIFTYGDIGFEDDE